MGFVEAENGGADVFVHISVVKKAQVPGLSEGQRISMRITETPKGRQAVSISLVSGVHFSSHVDPAVGI
jgi:cold shock protein